MIRIFIGGHGRCEEGNIRLVPDRMSIMWFGEIGKSVTKGYTKAVLRDSIGAIGDAGPKGAYSEHYLCDTLQLEATLRVMAFQEGTWDSNTYLVQLKKGYCIRLSRFMQYLGDRWPDDDIELRWAVCRSSIKKGASLTHDYDTKGGIARFRVSDGRPAPDPAQLLVDRIDEQTAWFTQWDRNLVQGAMSDMPRSSF